MQQDKGFDEAISSYIVGILHGNLLYLHKYNRV